MQQRFESIQRLAIVQNTPIPSFLRPHYFTFNGNALRDIIALGGIGDIPTEMPVGDN